jgi:membrane protein YqaA with SNARE-associated domain
MEGIDLVRHAGWHGATFTYCLAAGLLPFLSSEAYLLWLAVAAPKAQLLPLAATACLGQMTAKSLVYAAGRGLLRLPAARDNARLEAVQRRMGHGTGSPLLVFLSALTGLPPFYWFTLAAGTLRWRFVPFFLSGLAGRALRFSAVLLIPQALERSLVMTVGSTSLLLAALTGLMAGAHASTWGMYKDSPYEGFELRKYLRSLVLGAGLGLVWELVLRLDLAGAGARLLLFGLTYVAERAAVEVYKACFREEDQSKYAIPMQLAVGGRVVHSKPLRWIVAASWAGGLAFLAWGMDALQHRPDLLAPGIALVLAGSLGGWISACGGAFKDAPIEGFELLKFFRSPSIALLWSFVISGFTSSYVLIGLGSLGFTIATIETYKTFNGRPPGKWAGKPLVDAGVLAWRGRFAPVFFAIWALLIGHIAWAWAQSATLTAGM